MVRNRKLEYSVLFVAFLLLCLAPIVGAVQWWQTGEVTDVQDTDVFMLRRPGLANYSGTRSISGGNFKAALTTAGPQGPQGIAGYDGNDGTNGANGTNGTNGTNGATGATGTAAIYCNISGGSRGVTYDSTGVNPQPAQTGFIVQLWEGAKRVTAQAFIWFTGGPSARIYGSGSSAGFTPSVKPAYSAYSSNNFVAVQAKYSTASGGRRWCTAGTPVAVTRTGIKGDTGPAGAPGSPDTQAQILAKIATSTDGAILTMQQGPAEAATVAKFQIKDRTPGNVRIYCDTTACYFKDLNGYVRIQIDPASYSIFMRDAANKLRWSVDTFGQIKQYRGDGTKLAFQTMTAGRVIIQ